LLGAYTDVMGRRRELMSARRVDGCVLVLDRDARTRADSRLVALLASDEPAENAAVVCEHYLRDERRGHCRALLAEDLICAATVAQVKRSAVRARRPECAPALVGQHLSGREVVFRLETTSVGMGIPELRWRSRVRGRSADVPKTVCLREAIGVLESYEPVCGQTIRALAAHHGDEKVSTAVLRAELERVQTSPIVLNGKLRRAVLAAIEHEGVSMSEIAIRCGRIKRESKGCASGETSWLARRVGLLPESGSGHPTPWIHSDVLALIARDGLGISPREVELG
jgi:hypothetical protein